jgi:hypothetical protein
VADESAPVKSGRRVVVRSLSGEPGYAGVSSTTPRSPIKEK